MHILQTTYTCSQLANARMKGITATVGQLAIFLAVGILPALQWTFAQARDYRNNYPPRFDEQHGYRNQRRQTNNYGYSLQRYHQQGSRYRSPQQNYRSFLDSNNGNFHHCKNVRGQRQRYHPMYPRRKNIYHGNSSIVRENSAATTSATTMLFGDYSHEPDRSTVLKVNVQTPFNAETPPGVLVQEFTTPTDIHFVRNHGSVPLFTDANSYSFQINNGAREMSLYELQCLFPPVTINATLMCAGNRRGEMNLVAPVKGTLWGVGAMGNAYWTGVRLRDLLLYINADTNNPNLHVEFIGEDFVTANNSFAVSIPMSKAADPKGDVLLAWEMNGEPLTRDHGFPLRVIVPGYIGARSCKWLKYINVLTQQSQSDDQQKDYKLFLPFITATTVDVPWNTATPISELSIQSAILQPVQNETVPNGSSYEVQGYALSNGKRIERVDVSLDGGNTFQEATMLKQDEQSVKGYYNRYWSWSLWSLEVDNFPSPCTVVCRAWDVSSNTQPGQVKDIWNFRGLMNNAWHKVNVMG